MTKTNIGYQEQIYTKWTEIWKQDNLNFMDKNGLVPTYGNVKGKKVDWNEELFMVAIRILTRRCSWV